MRMPFGKYKSIEVSALPDDYIAWLLDLDDLREPLRTVVFGEAGRRNRQSFGARKRGFVTIQLKPEEVPLARRLFDAGYRTVARDFHPDLGGDVLRMQDLNSLAENVRDQLAALEVGTR
jgi:hypothetical protein